MPKAVYPGTFDPVTNGHLDLIERGSRLFTKLVVLVAKNPRKEHLFSTRERVALLKAETSRFGNVAVESCEGLTVDYVRRIGFEVILRGLRTTTDFVLEHQMALANRALAPEIETVLMMPEEKWAYLSSSLIREVVRSGGDVTRFVPKAVAEALAKKTSA